MRQSINEFMQNYQTEHVEMHFFSLIIISCAREPQLCLSTSKFTLNCHSYFRNVDFFNEHKMCHQEINLLEFRKRFMPN